MITYHDTEWGRPQHDDCILYEFLVLEGAQAGLSWNTILNKRDGYREAFANFDPHEVSNYTNKDVQKLLQNNKIVRNRRKIESAINNASRFLDIQDKYGSFDLFVWNIVGERVKNSFPDGHLPTHTTKSEDMSRIMKKHGFTFVGPVMCYAYMQAVGMVNDHTINCFLHGI